VADRIGSRLGRRTASLIAAALLAGLAGSGAALAASVAKSPTTTTSSSATASRLTATATATTATATTTATVTTTTSVTTAKAPAKRKPHKPKPAPVALSGWLADGVAFPQRALVLTAGVKQSLTASGLHVTENGTAVKSLTLTPVGTGRPGDAAVVVAIDQSDAMKGAGLASEIAGVRALAAVRPTNEELGVIGFDATPSSYLKPTTSTSQIATALAGTPANGTGSDPAAAIGLALKQLAAAKVALGAIVVISDGRAIAAGTGVQAVKGAAAAAHRPVITLGLNDAGATPASLRAVANTAPGTYQTVTPAQLTGVMIAIQQRLSANDVVRYRSSAGYGKSVVVSATADGVTGAVTAGYRSPARPRVVAPAKKAAPRPSGPDFANSTLLSPTPSFAAATPAAAAPVATGFWSSSSWVPVVGGLCAVLLVAAIALALHRPSKAAVRTRVATFIPLESETANDAAQQARNGGLLPSLQRGSWWPPFVEAVEISQSPHTPVYLVKRAAAIGVVLAVLVAVVSGSVLFALVPLIGWVYLLKKGVKRAAEKQRTKFADTLPAYLQDMASAIRVGRSFAGAVAIVGESADEPTRSQLERAATDEALGRPLEETLEAVSERMHSNDMGQVALIAGVHRRTGSNISEALDRVAEGARERADLRREMRALTSQAKMSSSVLTGLPVVLLLGLTVLSPQYAHPLLHTTMGLIALSVGGIMIFGGWKVMGKITRIKV
jgi:Flp pilus assembly protein TadB